MGLLKHKFSFKHYVVEDTLWSNPACPIEVKKLTYKPIQARCEALSHRASSQC